MSRVILIFIGVFVGIGCSSDSKNKKDVSNGKEIQKQVDKKIKKSIKKSPPVVKKIEKVASVNLSEKVSLNHIDYNLINARLLQKINKERKRHSLPAFSQNNDLKGAAKIHNDYMVRNNILDHTESNSSTPTMRDRIIKVGGKFRTAGENIQYEGFTIRTTNGVESIISPTYEELAEQLWQNWKTSPPHYKNIMNPEFIYLGTALRWSDQKVAVFATQVYGG